MIIVVLVMVFVVGRSGVSFFASQKSALGQKSIKAKDLLSLVVCNNIILFMSLQGQFNASHCLKFNFGEVFVKFKKANMS